MDAFKTNSFSEDVRRERITDLFVFGYHVDACVFNTCKGAVSFGLKVHTSPSLMFASVNLGNGKGLKFCRGNTNYLETFEESIDFLTTFPKSY